MSLLTVATPWEASRAPVGIDTLEMVSTAVVGLNCRNVFFKKYDLTRLSAWHPLVSTLCVKNRH